MQRQIGECQQERVGVLCGKTHIIQATFAQKIAGRQCRVCAAQHRRQLVECNLADRSDDLLLAAVVFVKPSRAVIDPLCDRPHRKRTDAFVAKNVAGCLENGLLGSLVAPLARRRCRSHQRGFIFQRSHNARYPACTRSAAAHMPTRSCRSQIDSRAQTGTSSLRFHAVPARKDQEASASNRGSPAA